MRRSWLLVTLFLCLAAPARADLPQVIAHGLAGPFDVTVLAETPIRPGSSGWIVWLDEGGQNAATSESARVEIEHGGMHSTGVAPGPIPVHVHTIGRSTATVHVRRHGRSGTLDFAIDVAPPAGLVDHWRSLSIVPIGLLVFGLHQWRARRKGR